MEAEEWLLSFVLLLFYNNQLNFLFSPSNFPDVVFHELSLLLVLGSCRCRMWFMFSVTSNQNADTWTF
ncbi:hypothetical protein EUGRSUZ_H02764 [Eucalyptus grandis]|uniref:Uncharacterized protein n=2 Tax=Eucalyptus grandis TaxID=71139 RepID=A0ACC3JSG5_EUCGR|nr:hypothetical protein EUGRSUZ_H02764 [Eucalyptus grandis]